MELKPGYVETGLGPFPQDWIEASIGGFKPFVTSGSRGWAQFYSEFGDLFVRITNMTRDAIGLDLSDVRVVNLPEVGHEGARTQLHHGDVLVSVTADIGIISYIDESVPLPAYINQHIALVRFPHDAVIDPKFVAYFLARGPGQRRFKSITDQGAKAGINLRTVRDVPLVVPPTRQEQEAIATALSDVDALLEGLDRLIAKKRDLKQAAMQQLLTGQTRLPGYAGEWETQRLGDVAEIVMGQSPSSSNYNSKGDGLPLIQGNADIANRITIRRFFTTQITKQGREGDVLMSVRAPVGEISRAAFDVCLGRGVCALRFPNDFLYHYLIYLEPTWARHSKGSTFDSINSADLKAVEIPVPVDSNEQVAIAAFLSDMDVEIEALEQRRAKTANLKQAMMQELLTGRTRLVEPQVTESVNASASQSGKGHNWAFNEAVVIATLVKHFGSETYPLGRKRYTKLAYLLHRHVERKAEGYLKKAAGPYNPQTKYGGPEKIAKQNGYIQEHKGPKGHIGFIAADNVAQAEGYFEKWYGLDVIDWLNQFRFSKNDDLEVLATVDMAAEELRAAGKDVDVAAVKDVIASHPEWEAKLDRSVFSGANIAKAIKQSEALLGAEMLGGSRA